MILLDTEVLSEEMTPAPDVQAAETLFISSLRVAELMFGVGGGAEGRLPATLVAGYLRTSVVVHR